MGEIDIILHDQWNFQFETNDLEIYNTEIQRCCYCGTCLDKPYSYIIKSLKEAGLLNEDYDLVCCFCSVLKKFGLLSIRNNLCGFRYDEINDVLRIEFSFPELTKKGENGIIIWNEIYIRIHDYSKIKQA